MRIGYLECFSGVSGDMFLGALVNAGVDAALLRDAAAKLGLGAELRISCVDRSGISATKVNVLVNGKPADANTHADAQHSADSHTGHSHAHGGHSPEHNKHSHTPSQDSSTHRHGRSLPVIRKIIQSAGLPAGAEWLALRAFELLGEAEAKIHNLPIEKVHFHEVGAVDAIVDIVCTAVGCDALRVDQWICSPVNVGGGTVCCAHGDFPVPAPATLELLRGIPIYSSSAMMELATPTGAALLRALQCQPGDFPASQLAQIGYGAGARNPAGSPNVLRLSVGESSSDTRALQQRIVVLETTLDDLSPQVLGYVGERLLAEGALDVYIIPAQMKKNRPGSLLTVLCLPADAAKLRQLLFAETTTLGIRAREEFRETLERRIVSVSTKWGAVRVKEAGSNGRITHYSPEYEDCRLIAESCSIPLREVQEAAIVGYLADRSRRTGNSC
jgi:uncharacterized protein (TIGR00299 family) protein